MIQACLNGARPPGFHPALPLDAAAMCDAARTSVVAGADALHMHPRDPAGRESLSAEALDPVLSMLRSTLPGVPVGVSTGAWIEGDRERTLVAIAGWRVLPDFASVNLCEAWAPAVFEALHRRGVGIEAGLACATDAERFLNLGFAPRTLRILVEMDAGERAAITADAVLALTARLGCPRLLHGTDATMWPMARKAAAAGLGLRVGLEDGDRLPDGRLARDNAELVAAAHALASC